MAKFEPVYKEEEEAFTAWYVKTPMGKKRAKILEGDDDEKGKDMSIYGIGVQGHRVYKEKRETSRQTWQLCM